MHSWTCLCFVWFGMCVFVLFAVFNGLCQSVCAGVCMVAVCAFVCFCINGCCSSLHHPSLGACQLRASPFFAAPSTMPLCSIRMATCHAACFFRATLMALRPRAFAVAGEYELAHTHEQTLICTHAHTRILGCTGTCVRILVTCACVCVGVVPGVL